MIPFRQLVPMLVASMVALESAVAQQSKPTRGTEYDIVVTSSHPGLGRMVEGRMTSHAIGSASRSRVEVISVSDMPTYAVGDYTLTVNGRRTHVRPASKTYVDVAAKTDATMKSLQPDVMSQMAISDVQGKLDTVAVGEIVEGRPTTHYRSTVSYRMTVAGQEAPTTIVTEQWLSALPGAASAAAAQSPELLPPGVTSELVKKMTELQPETAGRRALRYLMEITMSMAGQTIVTTMKTEIKNLREVDVDPSIFAIPAGYTKVDK